MMTRGFTILFIFENSFFKNALGWDRTNDLAINSRALVTN